MLEGFRVPVSQHLGGLGYPNVGVSSVRRQRWRWRQELTNIWIVRVAVLGFPWNLGWRNQYRVQITATKCPRFPLQFKSPKSSASYPGSTLGSSAMYNPWSQVNHTLACLLCYIQVLELIVAGEEDGPFSLACGAARHSCGTC